MHRFTILVDAGYLLRQAAEILSNKTPGTGRGDITIIDPQGLITMLVNSAKSALQNDNLLRVYWYDGVKTTMTAEHRAIMALPDVQFRAGTVNGAGQQKGVDSRIVTDLVELAGHHAVCDAMLITGDGDLAIGIELAQRRGVRVAVLGIEDMTVGVFHNQSHEVVNVADRVARIGRADIAAFIQYTPRQPAPPKPVAQVQGVPKVAPPAGAMAAALVKALPAAAGATTAYAQPAVTPQPAQPVAAKPVVDEAIQKTIESAIDGFIANHQPPLLSSVVTSTGSIESVTDRGLLVAVCSAIAVRTLNSQQKNFARAVFRARATTFPK